MIRYLPFLLVLAVWILAFVDCLNTPPEQVRRLPKTVWLLVILLAGWMLAGPVAWFEAGRPRRGARTAPAPAGQDGWVAPDDNPEFLRALGEAIRARGEDGQGGVPRG